jgi:predicted nucleic acid-binding protein
VSTVVLVEVLTGDHRRDFHENHLLRMCQICPVNEATARAAARMRTATGRADDISATDAVVAAFAASLGDSVVLTSDPTDLRDLVNTQSVPVIISAV